MKLAIIYASVHHKNTLKLLEAIKSKYPEIELFDATKVVLKDLMSYDIIGIASGIYFNKFHKSIAPFLENNLPEHKKVFLMYTSGAAVDFGKDIIPIIQQKKCSHIGTYGCRGFDTFAPFKLIGGLQKGHPTLDEINGAVDFIDNLLA